MQKPPICPVRVVDQCLSIFFLESTVLDFMGTTMFWVHWEGGELPL